MKKTLYFIIISIIVFSIFSASATIEAIEATEAVAQYELKDKYVSVTKPKPSITLNEGQGYHMYNGGGHLGIDGMPNVTEIVLEPGSSHEFFISDNEDIENGVIFEWSIVDDYGQMLFSAVTEESKIVINDCSITGRLDCMVYDSSYNLVSHWRRRMFIYIDNHLFVWPSIYTKEEAIDAIYEREPRRELDQIGKSPFTLSYSTDVPLAEDSTIRSYNYIMPVSLDQTEPYTISLDVEAYDKDGITFTWTDDYAQDSDTPVLVIGDGPSITINEEFPKTSKKLKTTFSSRFCCTIIDKYHNIRWVSFTFELENHLKAVTSDTGRYAQLVKADPDDEIVLSVDVFADDIEGMEYEWSYYGDLTNLAEEKPFYKLKAAHKKEVRTIQCTIRDKYGSWRTVYFIIDTEDPVEPYPGYNDGFRYEDDIEEDPWEPYPGYNDGFRYSDDNS